MSSPDFDTDTADARFLRMVGADAQAVARLREEFTEWLWVRFDLDDVRSSDIVLVVNEALSNAAEYAYRNWKTSDSITLLATHNASTGALVITVADRGEWRPSEPANQKLSRGRGIPLMEALCDHVEIDRTAGGTHVHLGFDRCRLRLDDRSRISA